MENDPDKDAVDDFLDDTNFPRKDKTVFVPLHLAAGLVRRTKNFHYASQSARHVPLGKLHQIGEVFKIPFLLVENQREARMAMLDTGATPTVCRAEALRELDPNFENKLVPVGLRSLNGLVGSTKILGVYVAQIILPHPVQSMILERVEFLVAENYSLSYDFIIGQDVGKMYNFSFSRPNKKAAYLQLGTNKQQFFVSQETKIAVPSRNQKVTATDAVSNEESDTWDDVRALFPSDDSNVDFDEFLQIVEGKVKPELPDGFDDALKAANVHDKLSKAQREQLERIIRANAEAFALEGKTYPLPQCGAAW